MGGRNQPSFNLNAIKKLNRDLALKLERERVQQDLQSVKKGSQTIIDNLQMMTFEDDPSKVKGWKSIYVGLYSPFQNKYTTFMKQVIERAKEESESPVKTIIPSHTLKSLSFATHNLYKTIQSKPLVKSQKTMKGSIASSTVKNSAAETPAVKSGKHTPKVSMTDLTLEQLNEQHDKQLVSVFEGISRHKRDLLEQQIRNGAKSLMAQKYLQLIQERKLKRTLLQVFNAGGRQKDSVIKRGNQVFNFFNLKPQEDVFSTSIATPVTEAEFDEGPIIPQQRVNHRKTLSLDFKFTDLKKKNYFLVSPSHHQGETLKMSKYKIRSQSGPGRYDSRLLLNKKKGGPNQKTQPPYKTNEAKMLIRRKSCECQGCGGEVKKRPQADIYEEEEHPFDQEEEKDSRLIQTIQLRLQEQGIPKPRNSFLLKNLKNLVMLKSTTLRRVGIQEGAPALRRSSKTLTNIMSSDILEKRERNAKERDFKQALAKIRTGSLALSPVFDAEKHRRKKKRGLRLQRMKTLITEELHQEDESDSMGSDSSISVDGDEERSQISPLKLSHKQSSMMTKTAHHSPLKTISTPQLSVNQKIPMQPVGMHIKQSSIDQFFHSRNHTRYDSKQMNGSSLDKTHGQSQKPVNVNTQLYVTHTTNQRFLQRISQQSQEQNHLNLKTQGFRQKVAPFEGSQDLPKIKQIKLIKPKKKTPTRKKKARAYSKNSLKEPWQIYTNVPLK